MRRLAFGDKPRQMLRAPALVETERLVLRPLEARDAPAVFAWASDVEVTRLVAWPTHASLADTRRYLDFARAEWEAAGTGAYLVERSGVAVGSTGLHHRGEGRAEVGYVLRRDAWGQGCATEACAAMLALGQRLGLARVEARCHHAHQASARVLEKAGFVFERLVEGAVAFPQLGASPESVRLYAWTRVGAG